MAQKKKRKKTGYCGGKPDGMNYVQMLQWQKSLQDQAAEFAKNETQRVVADRQAQRVSWMYIVALNEKFGFAAKRTDDVESAVRENMAEYDRLVKEHGQDYADESLRRRVSKIRGREVTYLYEDQYPVNSDLSGADFASVRESAERIY